tara:strand:+ start:165 stop:2726 length:2562 start_codon:yes stop_codon:yes gene_type:complete
MKNPIKLTNEHMPFALKKAQEKYNSSLFSNELRHNLMKDKYPVPNGLDKQEFENRVAESKGLNIRPTVKVVMFWLGEQITNEHKIATAKVRAIEALTKSKQATEEGQNIEVPEIVDIDYSDVKNISTKKYSGKLNSYKDGILIVSEDNPHQYHLLEIRDHVAEANSENNLNSALLATLGLNKSTYWATKNDLSFLEKFKDKLNIYIVFKRAYKNKAFKIVLHKNNYVRAIIKRLKSPSNPESRTLEEIINALPEDIMEGYLASQSVIDHISCVGGWVEQGEISSDAEEKYTPFNKKDILLAGYYTSMILQASLIVLMVQSIFENDQNIKEIDEDTVISKFKGINQKSTYEVCKRLFDLAKGSEVSLNDCRDIYNKVCLPVDLSMEEKGKLSPAELVYLLLRFFTFYSFTERGTFIPGVGEVNTQNATRVDCFWFWISINNFNLFNRCLEPDQFPILLNEGSLINEQSIIHWIPAIQEKNAKEILSIPKEHLDFDEETKSQIKEILNEAMDQKTGLWIPYNACVEIRDDPIFKYVRFIEYEKVIAIFAHDHNERCLSEIFMKEKRDFKYWLFNSGNILDKKIENSSKRIYLKLAACIRDWKVLIERDSTMSYRGRNVINGSNSSKKRIIYLPRTKYVRNPNKEQQKKERLFFSENRKFSGQRRQHARRLKPGTKASRTQLLLAKDLNFPLPPEHTFVQECLWGKKGMTQKQIRYRTKSLNNLFYASDAEVQKAKEIHELSPAGFEEHSEKYVAKLGWEIRKRNNYDGGIDIRALRDTKEDVEQLFVQCKHWKKPIGPDVLRELVGSAADEKSKYKQVLMVITSSKFTPGAVNYADRNDIILVDGDILIENNKKK